MSMKVKVNKNELLKTVTENRNAAMEIYDEAMLQYRQSMEDKLHDLLQDLDEDGEIPERIKFPKPFNPDKEYEKVINILVWETENIIEIDSGYLNQILQDDWDWVNIFTTSNSEYVGKFDWRTK